MGAEYFLKKGFRHFAFYGTRGIVWSDERYQGFRDTIRAGQSRLLLLRVAEYVADRPVALRSDPADHLAAIAAQAGCNHGLRRQSGLPYNGGLPARRGGGNLRIPDDIAVLGVDNDETICRLSAPNLSSLNQNIEQGGYDVARLIDRIIRDPEAEREDVMVCRHTS